MQTLAQRLKLVLDHIRRAERKAGRSRGQTRLLAVSKRHPATAIRELYQLGQRFFGENYVSEALEKMDQLADLDIEWHYIGPIQSNKTREIASRFDWVHSIDREKILRRLGEQRPPQRPPLNCCIQLNIGAEAGKSGTDPDGVLRLLKQARALPQLRIRGLMAIPPASDQTAQQRRWFARLRLLYEELRQHGHPLDTLSMGMSQDLDAAILEGATVVRIGTALFGPRER